MYFIGGIDGKKRPKYNKKRKYRGHAYGVNFCLVVLALTFIPLIGYFIYNVIKDPITPTLFTNAQQMMRDKTLGYLSNGSNEKQNEQKTS